jgi:hypothetical protein
MASKRKGLYVLFEGLWDTVIDSQVLLHAREMKEHSIVDFEIWSFACFDDLYEKSLARMGEAEDLSRCLIRVFRCVRPAMPFSCIRNAFLLYKNIRKFKPEFDLIHARTDYSAAVCSYLKFFTKFDLIWDCRGDAKAEFLGKHASFRVRQNPLKWYQLWNFKWRVFLAAKACQGAIFVSNPLKKMMEKVLNKKPFQIIPSAATEKLFYFEKALRRKTRERLGYRDGEKVIVYCGSLAVYQCYSETVEMFTKLYGHDRKYKLLILTPQKEEAQKYLQKLPQQSYKVFSAKITEVNAYLNAADYAVLLRKHDHINAVASPTKFAEYCLVGLPIIMTNSVSDSYALAKKVGNLCEYRNGDISFTLNLDRKKVMRDYRQLVSRSAVIDSFRRIYFSI